MTNTLIIKNLHYSVNNRKILNDISFESHNGIIALLGNNGVGKTTLMNIIAGILKPDSGEVYLNEASLSSHSSYPINLVGYLPQSFEIYDNITGYDFLSYVYDLKRLSSQNKKQVLTDIIEEFNLNNVAHKKVRTYSGGYKRRLGIAQAVIGRPKLVIIDEPTVGLDPQQRIEFRKFLSEISLNTITLISTHIIEDVELFSDRLLIIGDDHSLKFNGSINEIISLSSNHLMTATIPKTELAEIRKKFEVIEEKRITNELVKIKYVKSESYLDKIPNSCIEEEVSLENAYIHFQKLQNK